ncbi:MAG: hypothetical protein P5674_23845, partial [Limnospira sp. PMC 289.06]|nr:hypothetical protein [Limnospira sp. PMC 289.06]
MTSFIERLNKFYPEKRRYALEKFPEHLVNTAQTARLQKLLTDFDFIQAKLAEFGVQALIEDYDLAMSSDVLLNPEQTETLQLIAGTLRLSAHVLESDKTQLAGQLWGRLLPYNTIVVTDESKYFWEYLPLIGQFLPHKPVKTVLQKINRPSDIETLLETAKQWRGNTWFRPLTATLTPPGGPLIRTLSGHSRSVNAVAIAPDGKRAVSASEDKTLKLWDLEQGRELATLSGHSRSVNAVAIAPDGKRAVSASEDKTLKLWDLEQGRELATL